MSKEKKEKKQEEEKAQETPGTQEADETQETSGEESTAEEAVPQEDWKARYDDMYDRFMRLAAEFDNFRKRSQKEKDGIFANATAKAVTELLPTYDNLERAVKAETTDPEYKKGVEMTMTQLSESFKKLEVELIKAEPGTVFDPNLHNAVMHVEDEDLGENVIAEVFQQGFVIGGKVIRHAMVKVAN